MPNSLFLVAAAADFAAVFVHGILGYRAMIAPLIPERLFATPMFGDAEMSGRIYIVAFQLITAVFLCSAVALTLLGLGVVHDPLMARFIAVVHASFVLLAALIVGRRLPAAIGRPVPIAFFSCIGAVAVLGWLG
jgi:hypothetical protein